MMINKVDRYYIIDGNHTNENDFVHEHLSFLWRHLCPILYFLKDKNSMQCSIQYWGISRRSMLIQNIRKLKEGKVPLHHKCEMHFFYAFFISILGIWTKYRSVQHQKLWSVSAKLWEKIHLQVRSSRRFHRIEEIILVLETCQRW